MEDLLGGGVRGGDCARCWWLLFSLCWYSLGFSFPVMIFVHCRGSQVYLPRSQGLHLLVRCSVGFHGGGGGWSTVLCIVVVHEVDLG